ncbi:MAG: hypothetical protein JJT82_03090 [Legionellaceae bacterium]|nr:hypothetical protein [Legionellaceae bacterium]
MFQSIAAVLLVLGFMSHAAWADEAPLVLDKVSFQLSAKDWVSTDKALLEASVDMRLNNADMVQARADILDNLQKIAKGEWHITQFNRSQDSSGLEQLSVVAQARIEQSALTNVYDLAKKISKPGAAYRIDSIDFSPGLPEQQAAKNTLRSKLYQQVQAEIERLNAVYPEQHYTINQLLLVEGAVHPANLPRRASEMKTMLMAQDAAAAPISVSNELLMTAIVDLASNRVAGKVKSAEAQKNA